MKFDLRPTIAPLSDPVAVRQAARHAARRSRQSAGAYAIVTLLGALPAPRAIGAVLRGEAEVFYIGGTCSLRDRLNRLLSGLTGTPYRHGAADKILAEVGTDRAFLDYFLIVVPCWAYDSLETFLIKEHVRFCGHYPPGNDRRGGSTNARHRPAWVHWEWSMLSVSMPDVDGTGLSNLSEQPSDLKVIEPNRLVDDALDFLL